VHQKSLFGKSKEEPKGSRETQILLESKEEIKVSEVLSFKCISELRMPTMQTLV
jgi:hypothetical protein